MHGRVLAGRPLRWFGFAFFSMCALFSLPTTFAPGQGGFGLIVFSAIVLVVCCVLAFQSVRLGVSRVGDSVRYRSNVWTRSWAVVDVAQFDVREGNIGPNRRWVVYAVLRDGGTYKLAVFNFVLRSRAVADEITGRLNALLKAA